MHGDTFGWGYKHCSGVQEPRQSEMFLAEKHKKGTTVVPLSQHALKSQTIVYFERYTMVDPFEA